MTENVENLILEHLRGLRTGQDGIVQELRELQSRVSSLEAAVAQPAAAHAEYSGQRPGEV